MKTYFGSRWIVAVTLVALLVPAAALLADTQAPQVRPGGAETSGSQQMPATCEAVMAQREELNARMAALDDRLDALVAELNAATGTARSDVTAEIVAELVAQSKQMHEMVDRQPMTMHQTMGHGGGMSEGVAQCMPGCPMMKAMTKAPKERVQSPHRRHHWTDRG